MEFMKLAVDDIQHNYDEVVRVKAILRAFIYTMEMNHLYNNNNPLFNKFNDDGGLSKPDFSDLLSENKITIPGHLFNHIFHEIDDDHSQVISKNELEEYLSKPMHSNLDVLKLCLRSFAFWASTALHLGSIFFMISFYTTDYQVASAIDKVSWLHLKIYG